MAEGNPQRQHLAIIGGRVIDGLGRVHDGLAIVIEGDRIVAVGRGCTIPTDAEVIDTTGQTVLPGLIDMHGHMYARAHIDIKSQFDAYPLLYLAGGVTTVRDPGELNPKGTAELRARVAVGETTGPRVFTAGPYFDHAPSFVRWINGTETPEQALAMFGEWRDEIDFVKVYSRIHEEQFVALEGAAHAAGLAVIGHLGSLTAQRAVDLGINGLEHGIFTMSEFAGSGDGYDSLADLDINGPMATKLLDSIVKRKVVICPTTITFEFILNEQAVVTPDWLSYLTPEAQQRQREQMGKRPPATPEQAAVRERVLAKQWQFVKRVHELGGTVVAGTDPTHPGMMPGFGMHRELEHLVSSGFTPLEAIRAATSDSARVLGADDLGDIAPGKLADLVIVDGDPRRNIADIRRTRTVIHGGVLHDPVELRRQAIGKIS